MKDRNRSLAKAMAFTMALVMVAAIIVILPAPVEANGNGFSGGDGSLGDPYQISTLEQLDNVRNDLTAHYILTEPIEAEDTRDWNNEAGWTPIGNEADPFTGSFDGQNNSIMGLFSNHSSADNIGLFGYVGVNGVVKNLGLFFTVVKGNDNVGALVGTNHGDIYRIAVEDVSFLGLGKVEGNDNVGGIVGYNNGNIHDSYSTIPVEATATAGGLVGYNHNDGTINRTHSVGKVEGANAGGLVGDAVDPTAVENSYWNTNTSGIATGIGDGLTTQEMKDQASFSGFDFDNVWRMGDNYPRLQEIETPGDIIDELLGFLDEICGSVGAVVLIGGAAIFGYRRRRE